MQKILFSILLLSFLTIGTSVFAQDSVSLPDSGLTPDSNFYFLKSWKESIQTFFTFGAENKAKQFLHLSEVRLAEYLKMAEKGDPSTSSGQKKLEIAEKTLEKYEKQLGQALEKTKEKTAINEKILKHQEVLKNALEKAPENTKSEIEKAIEVSKEATLKMVEDGMKQASPEVQGCVKLLINKIIGDGPKGTSDIQSILLNCLMPGTKIPPGGGINMESLKKMEEFYGSSLSPKDLEALKKAQEQLKGIIPQGNEIPSSGKSLNWEDIKNAQEKMQEEYNKLTPEELDYIKKMQEQQQENITPPPEIPGGSSGTGMGM